MKLKDCREAYYTYSGKTSDVGRQLAFAGIAVIWIFKTETTGEVPREFAIPAVLLVLTLTFDFLQYALGTMCWGFYHRYKEIHMDHSNREDAEIIAPRWINWPVLAFFVLKVFTVAVAYILLLAIVCKRIGW